MALRLTNAITPDQLKKLKEEFKEADIDGSKSLSKQEMKNMNLGLSPQEIDAFDKNGDGHIDFKEFVCLMDSNTGVSEEDDEVKQMFKIMDKNGDGTVTIKELEALIKKVGMKADFRKADLRELIKKADKGHDQEISFQEFKAYLESKANSK